MPLRRSLLRRSSRLARVGVMAFTVGALLAGCTVKAAQNGTGGVAQGRNAGSGAAGSGATRAAATPVDASAVQYLGVSTRLMDPQLVNLRVATRGTRNGNAADAYALCAAAQYALIRGYGFARHVRTNLSKDGGVWMADAVYTISPDYPSGAVSLNAGDVVADCKRDGIPTV